MSSTTLHLAGRDLGLAWNASARYRIGTLGDVERFVGLAYACAVLWAAGGAKFYRTPEDMASDVEGADKDAVNGAISALFAEPDAQKKSSLSSGPSPGSSSA